MTLQPKELMIDIKESEGVTPNVMWCFSHSKRKTP